MSGETDQVILDGYGASSTLVDSVLNIQAKGAAGKAALGAAERAIPVDEITAVEFRAATALRNGSVTIESAVGKTVLHFRRKDNEAAERLHGALLARSGVSRDAQVTAAFANERRDEWVQRAKERSAEARARRAERDAQRQRSREEFEAARNQLRPRAEEAWAELRPSWSQDQTVPQVAELTALLDAAEVPDFVDDEEIAVDLADPALDSDDAIDEAQESTDAGPSVEEQSAAVLDEAEVAARAGDIALEEEQIRRARAVARSAGGRRDRKAVAADVRRRIAAGRLRLGSRRLGSIHSESGFDRWARTGSIFTGPRGEKEIEVWSDRIITAAAAYPITAQTGAQVYLDGQETITQRPTLTRMVLFSPLPGSALLPGLALQKKEVKDRRRAEVQIRDVNWALKAALDPDALSEPRQLAEQINAIAAGIARLPPAPSAGSDLLTQLERLTFLLDRGSVSAAEAQAIRAALRSQK